MTFYYYLWIILFEEMIAFFQFIRQTCTYCFQTNKQSTINDQPLLQLQQMSFPFPSKDAQSQMHNLEYTQRVSRVNSNSNTQMPIDQKSIRQSEFQSIESYLSRQTESRRSFKISSMNSTLNPSLHLITSSEPIEILNGSENAIDSRNDVDKCVLKDEIEKIEAEVIRLYGHEVKKKVADFHVCHAIRLRMQGHGMLTLLIHKIEDYRICNLSQGKSNYQFCNKKKSLLSSFMLNELGTSSFKASKIKSYFRIECSTSNITRLLLLFKSREMMKALHNFTDIVTVDRETVWKELDFPILKVSERNVGIKGDNMYHLAWQITEVEFEGEEGVQVVEVGFSLDEGIRSWQRVLKVYLSQKGYLEIYSESCEEITMNESEYFHTKFIELEKRLLELKLL